MNFSNVVNYYEILEVHEEVSTEEIRRSFRSLIKKYHPDTQGPNKHWAESKTKTIIQAYKTLSDTTARELYDRQYRIYFQANKRQYSKKEDSTITIKMRINTIFNDLLNGQIKLALEKYEQLLQDFSNIDMNAYLNQRDYIDYKFLLAEAYEKTGKYDISIEFYENILEKGKNAVNRKHLFAEIKDRVRNIYCRKLAKTAPPEKALDYYEKVLKLNLYKNENAFIYKKMSECYLKLKEYENAARYLNKALSLKPNLQGINKLKTKLGQHIPNVAI